MTAKRFKEDDKEVLVLRAVSAGMRGSYGFVYPKRGYVRERNGHWDPEPRCGGGLHGFLWGHGAAYLIPSYAKGGKWIVVRVKRKNLVILDNGGKCKFKSGNVVFCGHKKDAGKYVRARKPVPASNYTYWNEIVRH